MDMGFINNNKNNKGTFWFDEHGDAKVGKAIVLGVILIFLIVTLFCSFKTINSGEVGLKVRFGKIVDSSLNEGFNMKFPYIEKIVKVNIKVQKIEINTETSSKDLQTVQTDIAVNYRIESDKASYLYKTVGNSYETTILEPTIKESIKSVIAQYTAEEIITKRNEVSSKCYEELQKKVEKYGIVIDNFNITNLSFGEEYSKAIENKQVAEQNLAKAKLDAEAKLVEAEATNKANELLRQNTTDEVLLKQFIEKWDGKLPSVMGDGNLMDISKILK